MEFEAKPQDFYAYKRVFEMVWKNFSQEKKVPPETSDFHSGQKYILFYLQKIKFLVKLFLKSLQVWTESTKRFLNKEIRRKK